MKILNKTLSLFLAVVMVFACLPLSAGLITAGAEGEENADLVPAFGSEYAKPGENLTVINCEGIDRPAFKWTVDGADINNDKASYTVKESDLEKMIKVTVYSGGIFVTELSMFCSELPVVYIDTENAQSVESKDDYINCKVRIQGNEKYNSENTTLYDGDSEIKGHGNSTWKRFPKKPYKLKLDKKADLFGMGKNKHWLLIANYIDESAVRNSLANEMADLFGGEYLSSVFVDVVVNGESAGLYSLSEQARIGSGRADIFDWEDEADNVAKAVAKAKGFTDEQKSNLETYLEENMQWMTDGVFFFEGYKYRVADYYSKVQTETNGGYLMEIDNYFDELSEFYTDRGIPVMLKKPEYLCTNPEVMSRLSAIVQEFENAIYSPDGHITVGDEKISYTDLCNVKSMVSFYLVNELLISEAGGKSTYFYKDIDKPIVFGPIWDFDWSADSVAPFGTLNAKGWTVAARPWFDAVTKDPYFAVKVRELYLKNRAALKAVIAQNGYIDATDDEIRTAALHNEKLWYYSRGFEEDTKYLKDFLSRRYDYFDSQFVSDGKAVASYGAAVNENIVIATDAAVTDEGAMTDESDFTFRVTLPENGSFNYYVNGKYVSSVFAESFPVSVTVPAELLNENKGDKNVITVRAASGMNFMCVTVYDEIPTLAKINVLNENGELVASQNAATGSLKAVLSPSETDENLLFEGLSDGLSTYGVNEFYTVTGNMTLTEKYTPCNNGRAHAFEWTEEGYYCSVCGAFKEDTKDYISVASCSYSQSNRYQNRYTGSGVHPVITVVWNGVELVEGKDYNIAFKNDVNTGFATYTVTGIRSAGYTDSVSQSYRIIPRSINSAKVSLPASSYVYTGKQIKPVPTIKYNGITLKEGRDYTLTYGANKAIGAGEIIVEGMGNFNLTKTVTFSILPAKVQSFKAARAAYNKIKLTWKPNNTYTGYMIYRKTSSAKSYTLVKTISDCTVSSYTDSSLKTGVKYNYKIKPFTTVAGKKYIGAVSSAVSATPTLDKPAQKNATATAKKYALVQWNKVAGANGYAVYRSEKSSGEYTKVATVKSGLKYTDKSVKTGKTYYYKIKAYRTVDKKAVYSAYSAVKSVKIKK